MDLKKNSGDIKLRKQKEKGRENQFSFLLRETNPCGKKKTSLAMFKDKISSINFCFILLY